MLSQCIADWEVMLPQGPNHLNKIPNKIVQQTGQSIIMMG